MGKECITKIKSKLDEIPLETKKHVGYGFEEEIG